MLQPQNDTPEERRRVADAKIAVLDAHQDFLHELHDRIAENPRLPLDDGTGKMVSKDVDYNDVLTFVREAGADNALIAIDPLTQITFSQDGRDYKEQSEFMREITNAAASTQTHVMMVAHYAKGGSNAHDPLDGIAGSSLFGKIAHNVLALIRHDPAVESNVVSRFDPVVEHRLSLFIRKSRGGDSGKQIAFDLHEHGPQFTEYGFVKPKAKGKK